MSHHGPLPVLSPISSVHISNTKTESLTNFPECVCSDLQMLPSCQVLLGILDAQSNIFVCNWVMAICELCVTCFDASVGVTPV